MTTKLPLPARPPWLGQPKPAPVSNLPSSSSSTNLHQPVFPTIPPNPAPALNLPPLPSTLMTNVPSTLPATIPPPLYLVNNADCYGGSGKETILKPSVKKYRHCRRRACLDVSESNIVNFVFFYFFLPIMFLFSNLVSLSFIPSNLASPPTLKKDYISFSDSLFSRFSPSSKERFHPFYQKPNYPSVPNTSQLSILYQYPRHIGEDLFSANCVFSKIEPFQYTKSSL